ncbi:MAG: hypothetical protein Greene071421_534 [Parcubacteria group bacterium Greene0714_21]|nr:MAG: hypothetical protein Greene041639_544 [Parcubacteria group bacterium Greene0416_39]TSC97645.1 MAG: hypothetical protein Greene101447_392 [Parcubacteria group bacterium Greene1014_47]TSD03875.1 MAG: hypothetical protein Greene071421_534 [Parcubacteria group bacterium Greene0714_21]
MELREITDKTIWEEFLKECQEKTFLHSWEWGEFQRAMRGNIWRFGFFSGKDLVALALVVKVSAKRGTFLLVPHGPIAKSGDKLQMISLLLETCKDIAKKEGASFLRINPIWERNEENNRMFKSLGGRNAPIQMHPEASWKLDITPSEEELFKGFRDTTRYLIRKCEKNPDITTRISVKSEDIDVFAQLHKTVSKRQKFVPFSLTYLKEEFEKFSKNDNIALFWGEYKGEVAAASFVVFWSGIAFYHHAVSVPSYAKFSLPYLLQWEAIKEAKRRGCQLYDFWGYVNPKTQSGHPWAGPTLFKMGFGGRAYEYVKTQDFPFTWTYWITYFLETFRRIRRNL